jgi:microcystin-dependent protein
MATGYILPFPIWQPVDGSGIPFAGGKMYVYLAGTTTPASLYGDSGLVTPLTNPVIADSAGRFPEMYAASGVSYKLVLKTSADVAVWTADNVALVATATPPAPAAVPTGGVLAWTTASAPTGYLLCDGTAVSRATYAALFAVISTAYGVGDGSTTFNVPDLRGKFPLGKATAGTGSSLAGTGGAIDHTHTGPSHTHSVTTSNHTHTGGSHAHTATISGGTGTPSATFDVQPAPGTPGPTGTHTHAVVVSGSTDADGVVATTSNGGESLTSGAAGTGATGTSNPPFLALNFIVKT